MFGLSSNRIAAAGNPMILMSIAIKPAPPPSLFEKIEEMKELMAEEGKLISE